MDVPKLSGAQAGRSESTERYGTEMTLAGMSTPAGRVPKALGASPSPSPTNRPTNPMVSKNPDLNYSTSTEKTMESIKRIALISTTDFLISSPLFEDSYELHTKDYGEYLARSFG
ncbi:MAG: hypothetical protein ABFC65_03810 [Rectinema sp.]